VIGVLRVNGALPVRAFSMRPNLEAPGHDTKGGRGGGGREERSVG
jgi:hypothetical protein